MARAGNRSLKAALSEAGFGERPPDAPPSGMSAATRELAARMQRAPAPGALKPGEQGSHPLFGSNVSSPRLALFKDLNRKPARTEPPQGVVSPPPWMRAAHRGRRHARLVNTFGWVMTLAVAGAIIGVTGRYLAIPPSALEAMQARP
jgi:hypothetical protein